MPESTSNSVFAVPAPMDGTKNRPLEHVSFSRSKFGTGFSPYVRSFR